MRNLSPFLGPGKSFTINPSGALATSSSVTSTGRIAACGHTTEH